jgi:hypothetical protein
MAPRAHATTGGEAVSRSARPMEGRDHGGRPPWRASGSHRCPSGRPTTRSTGARRGGGTVASGQATTR